MTGAMTKGEREDLQLLIRQREKVLKSAARQRSTELLADFENQMGQEFAFDQDHVWKAATEIAEREVQKAQKVVAARCRDLGIPDRFAPSLSLGWRARGYDNAVAKRRAELRRMAETRIECDRKQRPSPKSKWAASKRKRHIAIAGLTSDAARQFIEALPGDQTR